MRCVREMGRGKTLSYNQSTELPRAYSKEALSALINGCQTREACVTF